MSEENNSASIANTSETIIIPSWFTMAAWVAFVWNLLGIMAFVGQMVMTPEMLATLPEAEQALYNNIPLWVTIAFACAVFGGAIGSLLLALKKSIALYPLVISVIGVCIQMFHSFFIIDSIEIYGPGSAVMPGIVIVVAFVLVWLVNKAEKSEWIS
jgi:hypothetical protein